MQEYKIKRGFTKGFDERIVEGFTKFFDMKPEESDAHYKISYGTFTRLEAFKGEMGKTLIVDTESDISVYDKYDEETANNMVLDSNRRFRQYLEYVTGYNAKERAKKAKKAD